MRTIPQYLYKCSNENCDNEAEINCKMTEYTPIIPCEKCNSDMTRKVENMVAGYQAKCSGFYGKSSK